MTNELVDALKSINNTVCHSSLVIETPNYVGNFFLTLVDIDHRQNQLCNELSKIESDISTV